MFRNVSVVFLSTGVLALCACPNPQPAQVPDAGVHCDGNPPNCTISPGAEESAISSAIASAVAGTTFTFDPGTFVFTNTLSVPGVAGLRFQGAGIGSTILDFTNQTAGAGGISATLGNHNLKFEDFTIRNTLGDAIKVENGNGVVFYKVQVLWVNPADGGFLDYSRHGGYGLYPVQSQNVLMDHCQIMGARDTGGYVGQSYNIVVSNNLVYQNAAGIEIESSVNALVTGNEATQNSAGILVFALPNLQPPPGSGQPNDGTNYVTVSNNNVHDNNTLNFADPSGTVAAVPSGTGFFAMAASNVEVVGNTFTNNDTLASAAISYCTPNPAFCESPDAGTNPTNLDPFPHNIYFHGNTFNNNGTNPIQNSALVDGGTYPNQFGQLLAFLSGFGAFGSAGAPVPDLGWDGVAISPPYVFPLTPYDAGSPPNPQDVWIQSNVDSAAGGAATWTNFNLPVVGADPTSPNANAVNLIAGPFTVSAPPTGFPLPAVDAGITP